LWDNPKLAQEVEAGGHFLPGAPTGGRETIVGSALDARPQYLLRLTNDSWLPFGAAVFTAAFFLLLTFKMVLPGYVCAAIAFILIVRWLWETDRGPTHAPVDIGGGIRLPVYATGPVSHGWWATVLLLFVSVALYGALAFSYLYLWTVSQARWPAVVPPVLYPVTAAALLALGAGAIAWAGRALRREAHTTFSIALIAALLAIAGASAVDVAGLRAASLSPRDSSYGAIVYALVATQGLYAGWAVVMLGYTLARRWSGRLDRVRRATFDNGMLVAYYTAAQGAVGLALVHGFARWTS
jgi:cytochrome c oxidase subunit I+III